MSSENFLTTKKTDHQLIRRLLDVIEREKLVDNAGLMGARMLQRLNEMKERYEVIGDVRGKGLMIGIELNIEGKSVYEECYKNGLIINCTQGNILRLMPALNVTKKQANKALYILEKSLESITG